MDAKKDARQAWKQDWYLLNHGSNHSVCYPDTVQITK